MPFDAPTNRNNDKLLYTPGPLTTSASVKAAMQRDLGSRDFEFMSLIQDIRHRLLALAGQSGDSLYTAVPMQGSGTFGIEAVISSTMPPDGRMLVILNGAYGRRIAQIAAAYKIDTVRLAYPENSLPNLNAIEQALSADPSISMVAAVHCETTTGLLNPVAEIGDIAHRYQRGYFVDAMSSFGAVPVEIAACYIDYLVSSSNKCIEGVPGFSFVLARREALDATEGFAHGVVLNLLAQQRELDKSGQFRFTPPTHALLAFHQALKELEAEGGVEGRGARYRANHDMLLAGMRDLGFKEYIARDLQSPIITTFYYPDDPNFNFEAFYEHLNAKGFVIYPGKLGEVDCFRIGNIGRLFPADMLALAGAIRETLQEMGVHLMSVKASLS